MVKKIRVEFTVNIEDEYIDALKELAVGETFDDCRNFVRMQALSDLQMYLSDNGVPNKATNELM